MSLMNPLICLVGNGESDRARTNPDVIKRLEDMAPKYNQEEHIHPKRKEALSYVALYITAQDLDGRIENYWEKWESKGDKAGSNPPLSLEEVFQDFIQDPDPGTLLLLGEAGQGKTLTAYRWADALIQEWWAFINDPAKKNKPVYFPLFIHPNVSNWSHKALTGAFLDIVQQNQLEVIPLLVFVDGYDELPTGYR